MKIPYTAKCKLWHRCPHEQRSDIKISGASCAEQQKRTATAIIHILATLSGSKKMYVFLLASCPTRHVIAFVFAERTRLCKLAMLLGSFSPRSPNRCCVSCLSRKATRHFTFNICGCWSEGSKSHSELQRILVRCFVVLHVNAAYTSRPVRVAAFDSHAVCPLNLRNPCVS